MTDATRPQSGDAGSGLLEKLTGKVGKITALVIGVTAFLTAAQTLFKQVKPPAPDTACFKPDMSFPGSVALGEWSRKKFILAGKNRCTDNLQVRIEFKAASDRVRVEPPYQNEWFVTSVDNGDVTLEIVPPALTPLKLPLGGPVTIAINWIVRNADTQKIVRAGSTTVELQDDAPARVGTAAPH